MDVTTRFHVGEITMSFIVTPAMRKVRHSRLRPETPSNFTAFLSVSDRLFRSVRLRDDPHTINFGLDEFIAPDYHTLGGRYKIPLLNTERDLQN